MSVQSVLFSWDSKESTHLSFWWYAEAISVIEEAKPGQRSHLRLLLGSCSVPHCHAFARAVPPLPETPFPPASWGSYYLPGARRVRGPVLSVGDAVMNKTEDLPAPVKLMFKDEI